MKSYHLFEFMDLDGLPSGLRITLREILECGNSKPFRPYYEWVANEVLRCAQQQGMSVIVELGAGTAPITRHMSKDPRSEGLRLVVCDYNPDRVAYQELAERHPGKVHPLDQPLNFGEPHTWEPGTLLFLSATLHHIPSAARSRVIGSLSDSAECVLVFEPLRRTVLSVLFVFLSTVPAALLPILFLGRSGRLRRLLWCWILPVAPLMFWWDGIVSCLRQWTEDEWRQELKSLANRDRAPSIYHSLFCQKVSW
jgi:hypothetical protein